MFLEKKVKLYNIVKEKGEVYLFSVHQTHAHVPVVRTCSTNLTICGT